MDTATSTPLLSRTSFRATKIAHLTRSPARASRRDQISAIFALRPVASMESNTAPTEPVTRIAGDEDMDEDKDKDEDRDEDRDEDGIDDDKYNWDGLFPTYLQRERHKSADARNDLSSSKFFDGNEGEYERAADLASRATKRDWARLLLLAKNIPDLGVEAGDECAVQPVETVQLLVPGLGVGQESVAEEPAQDIARGLPLQQPNVSHLFLRPGDVQSTPHNRPQPLTRSGPSRPHLQRSLQSRKNTPRSPDPESHHPQMKLACETVYSLDQRLTLAEIKMGLPPYRTSATQQYPKKSIAGLRQKTEDNGARLERLERSELCRVREQQRRVRELEAKFLSSSLEPTQCDEPGIRQLPDLPFPDFQQSIRERQQLEKTTRFRKVKSANKTEAAPVLSQRSQDLDSNQRERSCISRRDWAHVPAS